MKIKKTPTKPLPRPLPRVVPSPVAVVVAKADDGLQDVRDAAIRRAKAEFDRLKAQPVVISRETPAPIPDDTPANDWKRLCKVTLKGDVAPPPLQAVHNGVQPMTAAEFAASSEREYFRGRKVMGLPPDFSMCPADRVEACLALARADRVARLAKKLGHTEKKFSEVKTTIKIKKQK